jgi:hypothetical protein
VIWIRPLVLLENECEATRGRSDPWLWPAGKRVGLGRLTPLAARHRTNIGLILWKPNYGERIDLEYLGTDQLHLTNSAQRDIFLMWHESTMFHPKAGQIGARTAPTSTAESGWTDDFLRGPIASSVLPDL